MTTEERHTPKKRQSATFSLIVPPGLQTKQAVIKLGVEVAQMCPAMQAAPPSAAPFVTAIVSLSTSSLNGPCFGCGFHSHNPDILLF